jgi:PEP-CTERM motif
MLLPTRFSLRADQARRAWQCLLTLVLAAGSSLPATAAIAPGGAQSGANALWSGNGELFVSVFDATAKISYTRDLGVTVNDFFVWGQQDGGNQRFWTLDDANWNGFLAQVNPAALRWSVLGFDTTGGTISGGVRLFTTARQGDEGKIAGFTNQLFTNGTGAAQAGTFFTAINSTGTHGVAGTAPDFAVHGNSVNADTDPGNGYFGSTSGLTSTLNGNAPFDSSNAVGNSSWYYYLTRSGAVQTATVLVDEFDNLSHDGYWGFVFVDPALYPDSPYQDSWLLSYTMLAHEAQPQVQTASFERERPLSFRRAVFDPVDPIGPVLTVPEPGSWGLLTAGLLGLLSWTRRRDVGTGAPRIG